MLDVARSRRCGRGGRPGGHRHGFTNVSGAAKAGDTGFTRVSRVPKPTPNCADRHEGWYVSPLAPPINLFCHTIRCRNATPRILASIRLTPKLP